MLSINIEDVIKVLDSMKLSADWLWCRSGAGDRCHDRLHEIAEGKEIHDPLPGRSGHPAGPGNYC